MANKNKGKMVQMLSPENYIRKKARSLPIYECRINEEWEESKMAQLSVVRQHTNGNITACYYLVDLMCLGIKDTDYMFNAPIQAFREHIEKIEEHMDMITIDYVLAHNIIYAGLEYAEEYGFKPHKDFTSITRFMLEEDTDDIELIDIECGLDGQPTYMQGPFDDEVKVKKIIAQLEKTAGPDNYSVLMEEDDDVDLFAPDGFDDDFDNDFDEDEFEEMPANEKKELFFNLNSRLESLTEEEHKHFFSLTNSIVDDLVDVDLHNQIYDEYFEDLNIETEEDEIPDQLLGIRSGDQPVSEEVKNRFIELYEQSAENPKQAAKELKIFEKKTNGLPCVYFLELILLQLQESPKYPTILKEYAMKYSDYPLIRILWVTEQAITTRNLKEIPEYPFKFETFFPDRETIHPIEKHLFLTMHAFATANGTDINRIDAFSSVLNDLDLHEVDEEVLRAIITLIKVNYLLSYLTR
ncbi:MAG: hypothetical protein WC384_13310 [Prolixibacteraceae bacterium]|jgi:hypothetical protein